MDVRIAVANENMDPIGTAKVIYQGRRNNMSCPKHEHLDKLLKLEEYKDFKPYGGEERDCFGNTQADLIASIREQNGEEYYQKNKNWLWSKLHWDLYMDVAR